MIPSQRHRFDMPRDVAYLNCAYMGPLSHRVREAGLAGAARKARPWEISPDDFFGDVERARRLFADLIGADAEGVAIVPSASYGLAIATNNLALGVGERVLVLAEQFPSHVYPWRAMAAARGAEVATVARPQDDDWTAAIIAALDARVKIVALPHCRWTDGGLIDLERVGRAARAVGARLVLDLTQSLGALPFDAGVVKPDLVVAATYKWLLGPYAYGFVWVAPDLRQGRPLEETWIGRAGAENFSGLIDYRDDYRPGARRFDVGEHPNFAVLPAAIAALEQICDWGVPEIAETLAARTAEIAARAADFGLSALAPGARAGHFLGLRFAADPPGDLVARLASEKIYVSQRGPCLRVTPHLYNDDEDVARLFDALGRFL